MSTGAEPGLNMVDKPHGEQLQYQTGYGPTLLGAPGLTTRGKDATRTKGPRY